MSTVTRAAQLTAAILLATALSVAKVQDKDIIQTLSAGDSTKTFVKLADSAGLTDMLKGVGPYTVFVPNDAAFDKLKADNAALYEKITSDKALLKKVVQYHVVSGVTASTDLTDGKDIPTLEGESIHVTVKDQAASLDKGTKIVTPDTKASNGTIHVVDAVLTPKSFESLNKAGG